MTAQHPTPRRRRIEQALRENGITPQGDDGIHSWRCRYPDQYGPCECFDSLVEDLEHAVEETP